MVSIGAPVMTKLLARRLENDDIHANRFLNTMRRAIDLFDVESYQRNGPSGDQGANIVCRAAISHLGPDAAAKLMFIGDTAECQAFNKLESLLVVAILLNDSKLLRYLIDEGIDVSMENEFFGSPLRLAAEEGRVEVLAELLVQGIGSTNRSKHNAKALRSSCQRGHQLVVEYLLDPQYQLEIHVGDYGRATKDAADAGHTGLVQYLIGLAYLGDLPDLLREVLWISARRGNEALIQMMIDKGVDVNAEDESKSRAIEYAAGRGHSSIVFLLLNQGAHLDYRGYYMSALHEAVKRGDEAVANLLLDHGADINYSGIHGPPMWEAAYEQHLGMMRLLLERGADLKFEETGDDCLWHAVIKGNERVVRILAEAGVDVNSGIEQEDFPPILGAIMYSQDRMREVLLELGARPIDPLQSPWAEKCRNSTCSTGGRPWTPPLLDW